MIRLLPVIIGLSLVSCTRLALLKEGVKQPKFEDYASLSRFLLKLGVRIRVIKIDADYQTSWHLDKNDLPHFKF